jgi:hypothetical protein
MDQEIKKFKEAIAVIGGCIRRDEKGEWHTTGFNEPGDNFGVTGDNIRVIAGSYLYQDNPEQLVIACGGRGQLEKIEGSVPVSAVIKKELMELGVPKEKIIEESESGNTFEQLRKLKEIAEKMKLEKINIISNRYHLPRIEAMIKSFPELNGLSGSTKVKFIEAEGIVNEHEREKWETIIKNAYGGEEMKKRILSEQKGLDDIRKGEYRIGVKLK